MPPWPNKKESYEMDAVIGHGATCVVQKAFCKEKNQHVAIKRIDLEKCGSSLDEILKEIQFMSSCFHDNVCRYFTSFVVKDELWVVMALMEGGSLLDILKHQLSKGVKGGVLTEEIIATVLKDVLQGMEYLHNAGQLHRDLKAGNILIGTDGTVKIADFGVSSFLIKPGERPESKKKPRKTFVGTPCWMSPEVMDQNLGYDAKADIWSFGITALEMATGTAPYAKFPPMKVLMLTMENPPPMLETCGELNNEDYSKYSKSFRKMVEKCLQKEPEKRPTASELIKNPFFKKAKDKAYLKENLVSIMPDLKSRAKKVRKVRGASGRLYKTEEGEWVWSDEDAPEDESGKLNVPPSVAKTGITSPIEEEKNISVPVSTEPTQSQPATTKPPVSNLPVDLPVQPVVQVGGAGHTIPIEQLQAQLQMVTVQLQQTMQQIMIVTQSQQQLLQLQQQGQTSPEMQLQSMQLLQQAQALSQTQQALLSEQQRLTTALQQARLQGSMQNMSLQQPVATSTHVVPASQPLQYTKLILRIRDAKGQLKDIKFDFNPSQDTADAIANDLLSAGLLDARNIIVVAANITKILENRSLERVTFPLTLPDLPPESIDEKKLIGFAQISRTTKA